MSGAQMIVGLGILGNYGPVTVSAEHHQVYAKVDTDKVYPGVMSTPDIERLLEQGWWWDDHTESWAHST